MKRLLEKSRYIVLLAVISTLAASVSLFVWVTVKTAVTVFKMFAHLGEIEGAAVVTAQMVAVLDAFFLAVILYIFAVAIYELFIGTLDMPSWLVINNLDDLKRKLSSVIALMLAVTFLEHVTQWKDPHSTLLFAVAIAMVMAVLVFYMKGKKE